MGNPHPMKTLRRFLRWLRGLVFPTPPPGTVCRECGTRPACTSYGRNYHVCAQCDFDNRIW